MRTQQWLRVKGLGEAAAKGSGTCPAHSPSSLYISFQELLCKVSIYQLLCISNVCVYTKTHRDRKANVPVLSRGEKSNFVVGGGKAHGILRAAGLQRRKLEPTLERSAVALGNN